MAALQSLVLDGIAEVDDAVLAAAASAPALQELSVCLCQAFTDAGLAALAEGAPGLLSLRIDECGKVTDAGIAALANGCKQLQALSVRRCSKLGDEALALLASRGTLRSLCVNGLPSVSTRTLKALAMFCKESLQRLDISFCRSVPEAALGLVADSCRQLQQVQLYGSSQITRRFLLGHRSQALTEVLGFGTAASS